MSQSRGAESYGQTIVLATVAVMLMMTAGAAYFLWQRHLWSRKLVQLESSRAAMVAEQLKIQAEAQNAGNDGNLQLAPEELGDDSREGAAVISAIADVLRAQQDAWNAGDIDQFMEYYWKSDELTFSSGGKTTRSWQLTLERYRQRYPSAREMGKLTFGELEITPLGTEAAMVLGQWRLTERDDEPHGNFTLNFRLIDGRWLIVHDHTSKSEEPD
ncbi:MAG: nuclear transport factor 2 family protein [Pirellulaceae bacterium]|nr:nuclear transport factor 2 family protein [Planctomycetales bacterium]